MNDNIDKNEIRKAIDRLQTEHPCNIAYDPTAFVNMEAVNTIKECVDKIARRMVEDTEINIICEFAKLYLEGVRPMVMPKQEWIPCSERLPEDLEPVNITWVNHEPEPYYHDIKDKNFIATGIHYRGRWYWYSTTCADYLGEYGSNDIDKVDDAVEIVAWMPLPTPYKAGDPDA